MSLTLKDINEAFEDLWLHTEQLPSLLDKWQEMVSDYLANVEPTETLLNEFEDRMDYWQKVLEENRTLFQAHQSTLKESIKTGEPNLKKVDQSKKYKH